MNFTSITKFLEIVLENIIFAFFLFRKLTPRNPKHRIRAFLCFVFFSCLIVWIISNLQLGRTISPIIIFLIRLILVSYCFDDTFSNKAFHLCLTCFMSILADQLYYSLIRIGEPFLKQLSISLLYSYYSYRHSLLPTVIYLVLECFIMLIFLFVLKNFSQMFRKAFVFWVIITALALLTSTSLLSGILNLNPRVLPSPYELLFNNISILILVLFLSTLLLNQITNKVFTENMQLAEQLHIREKHEEQNKALMESSKSLHKWKHDYTNHLVAMKGLVENQAYDKLLQYLDNQLEALPMTFPTIETGHQIIDAILTNKYSVAQLNNIAFRYSVILPKHIPLNDIELTGILGNLLDNALDACNDKQLTAAPYIEFSMKPKRSMLNIRIKNSSSGNYVYNKEGKLETTKEEKEIHGKGISNIISITETHSGFYQFHAEPDYFSVNICIPL